MTRETTSSMDSSKRRTRHKDQDPRNNVHWFVANSRSVGRGQRVEREPIEYNKHYT